MVTSTERGMRAERRGNWERHRNTILSMRKAGVELQGANGIMERMKREHNFHAK